MSFPQGYYQPRTNGLAIGAFVTAFFVPLIGAILGHVAYSQIKRTGEGGQGLAIAAIVIGWVGTLIYVVIFGIMIAAALALVQIAPEILESLSPSPIPTGF